MFEIQLIYLVFDTGEEYDIVSLIQHLDKDASSFARYKYNVRNPRNPSRRYLVTSF